MLSDSTVNSGLIKSVDINETDEYGYTGLHLAAEHGHLKVVEELMVGRASGGGGGGGGVSLSENISIDVF